MAFYALTIFTGAFLLFLVQPLIGKYILPWFGGGPGVWTTCMLFFQVMLVGGYAYAHGVSRWLAPRRQVVIQILLLVLAIAALPIIPSDAWKPSPQDAPVPRILALLAATIAIPYLVLSSTGPLMQRWFSLSFPGRSPYRLFALSNAGSLLALLSYPFYFEGHFTRQNQARLWSVGLVLYAAFTALAAWKLWCATPLSHAQPLKGDQADAAVQKAAPLRPVQVLLWLLLPACASALLLATTNKLCLDVAVVPFLWVLPLAVYLLSFIVAFDSPRWYARLPFTLLFCGALAAYCWAMANASDWPVWKQSAVYGSALFVCCLVCHGELYRLRPAPQRLTSFYLLISIGGALGGVFVAVLAPAVFNDFFELHWSLILTAALFVLALAFGGSEVSTGYWKAVTWVIPILIAIGLDRWLAQSVQWNPANHLGWTRWALWPLLVAFLAGLVLRKPRSAKMPALLLLVFGVGGLVSVLWLGAHERDPGVVLKSRNFYGVLTVYKYYPDDPESEHYVLQHGRITHGLQFTDPNQAKWPTTYFGQETGVGIAMRSLAEGSRKVGIVGLGTGTLAAYGRKGDSFKFYEINPQVETIANQPFSYLKNCGAKVEIARGDARLVMEREPSQSFDLLILDAFSSDSIPVHLLTREAMQVYKRHLKPNGILAVHISNHYLDLEPIVRKLAEQDGYKYALLDYDERDDNWWIYSATWMLLNKDGAVLETPLIKDASSVLKPLPSGTPLWTDDFASLFPILMRQ